jgi:hypothetical protein
MTDDIGFSGAEIARHKMDRTIPVILQWDETFGIGSDTGTPVDDKDSAFRRVRRVRPFGRFRAGRASRTGGLTTGGRRSRMSRREAEGKRTQRREKNN